MENGGARHNANNVHHQQQEHEGLIGKATGLDSLLRKTEGSEDTTTGDAFDAFPLSNKLPWTDSQRTGWGHAGGWRDQPWMNDDDRFVPDQGTLNRGTNSNPDLEAASWGAASSTADFHLGCPLIFAIVDALKPKVLNTFRFFHRFLSKN